MATREQAQELLYNLDPAMRAGLLDNPRPIDEVLRVHLLTESILEKLIGLALQEHAEAVLSSRLSYAQKLSICGGLKFDDESPLISSDVKGSLKTLNRLRNDVAHDITHETTDEDVEALFVGRIGRTRVGPALTGSVWDKLSSYKATITVELLHPELIDDDS